MKRILFLITIICILSIGFVYKTLTAGTSLMVNNPLLTKHELPNFQAIKPEHFEPAVDHVLEQYNQLLLDQVLQQQHPTWENTVLPLEEASYQIDKVWKLITHINTISNTDKVRAAYERVLPKITRFDVEIMQNEKLYNVYSRLKENIAFQQYNNAQQAIINHAIRDFKLAGITLPAEKKQQLKQLKQQLSELGNQFSKNILDATQHWEYYVAEENRSILDGLPEHTINLAKENARQQNKSGWILTIDFPCYYAVITFAKNRELRKTFYFAYNTRASDQQPNADKWDNTPIIEKILNLRQQLATLLGYNNYAEYSLVPKLAKNTQQVMEFITTLITHVKPQAKEEFATLVKFAKKQDNRSTLEAWDLNYYSELYQQLHYKTSQEMLRPYFPEPQVLSGMFKIAGSLFNIQIKEIPAVSKWHETVKLFAIIDRDNKLRGKFYIDLYARNYKEGGAWLADFLPRIKHTTGIVDNPIAFLEANFTPPTNDGSPTLLSHEEILILFHEFGHALHHILTKADHPSAAGINGMAWDAIELPSQFMENWAWEWEVIKDLSKHYKTGEQLQLTEFKKLLAVKNYNSAMQMLKQLEFSLFDFRIHLNNKEDLGKTPQQILDAIREQIAVVPTPAFNRFQNGFTHIFAGSYDAGYYSYIWAEVLSSDVFEKFKENGTFNPEIGKQFLTTILEPGGSRDAMELFIEFRGRQPTIDALLKHNGIISSTSHY